MTQGRKKKKRKACQEIDSEAGEETDEGEIESREVDYMSESSSDSEQEFQVILLMYRRHDVNKSQHTSLR